MKEYEVDRLFSIARGELPRAIRCAGVLIVFIAAGATAEAQSSRPDDVPSTLPPVSPMAGDPDVKTASCPGCASGLTNGSCYGPGGSGCVPGRTCGGWCDHDTTLGKLCGGIYDGLCCPDPCYEPAWVPGANNAFFQDGPRPVTQTRIRWDAANDFATPDSAEYFWGKIGTKGPANAESNLRYNSLTLYQEVAAKNFSAFVEIPYLSVDPTNNPSAAGLGDISVGTKAVLLDRELLLTTFQFRTVIPSGNASSGLGTGHVSLEPALLAALKLTSTTYLQAEIAEWIPVAGDSGFEGSIFHYHFALNQGLYQNGDALCVIGTLEMSGMAFRGMYTDPATGTAQNLSGENLLSAGPGIRFIFCKCCDLGFAAAFDFGNIHGPNQIYRTEFRVRF